MNIEKNVDGPDSGKGSALKASGRLGEKFSRTIGRIPTKSLQNVSYLTAGNFAVELINLVGFVYIARLLGAENYGVFVTVGAFVAMFDLLLLDGINKSIIREGTKDLERMHVHLENTVGLRNVLIAGAIVLCIASSFLTNYPHQTKLYIVLYSFQLPYLGLRGFLATVFQATEKMQYMALLGILNRVFFYVPAIVVLHLGYGLTEVFIISLLSNLLTLGLSFLASQKLIRFRFFRKVRIDPEIIKPGIVFSLMIFVGYFMTRVDLLMVSLLGTATEAGLYGLAFRIAEQGVALRNVTVTAFFPYFVKRFYSGRVQARRLIRVSLLFFVAISCATVVISFFIEEIVLLVFGAEFRASGRILRVLLFFLAFSWAELPITTAAQATHNEKYLLIISSIAALLNVLLNYVFYLKFGLIGIAYSTLVVVFFRVVLEFAICLRIMKRQGRLT